MKRSDPNWNKYIFKEHLGQVHYWLNRFEISRDVDHLDHAERNAEAVRPYLPECYQNLNLRGLYNLYRASPSLHIGG